MEWKLERKTEIRSKLQIRQQTPDVFIGKMGHFAKSINVFHSSVDTLMILNIRGSIIAHIRMLHELAGGEFVDI